MDTDNNPEGYYNVIENPLEKKEDVKSLFNGYKIIEHTNTETEYEYLEENDVVLEIVNPYRDENLFIELAEEFTLYFSSWHSHYDSFEYGYDEMKKAALAFINNEYGVICYIVDGKWFGSTLLNEKISQDAKRKELLAKMNFAKEHLREIKNKGVVILVDFWKPNNCYKFDFSKETESI